MQGRPDPPVGLVHDYLLVMRGAERTFAEIAECWPSAPIHTTLYDPESVRRFKPREVHTSVLQRTGIRQDGFRRLLPLFPAVVSRMDVPATELVLSSSSAFAHGVRVPEGVAHVCYCYTPFRYAWHERATALREVPRVARPALDLMLEGIRRWDLRAAGRVDHHIAISRISQRRIRDAYGRDSPIVHPPVEVDRFTPTSGGDHVLIVSELVAHKRIDVALEGIALARERALVVGDGPERARLEREFPSARFAGRVDDPTLAHMYASARAVVVPSFEEFGIVGVEAQAAGTPVVAPIHGGAAETVLPGETGVLLEWVRPKTIAEALRHEVIATPDVGALRAQAERFSAAAFRRRLVGTVEALTGVTGQAVLPDEPPGA